MMNTGKRVEVGSYLVVSVVAVLSLAATSALAVDTDGDGLQDAVETGTGIFIDKNNTGTSSTNPDTDGDGVGDWYEVAASYTNPNNANDKASIPYPLPDPDSSTGVTNKKVKVFIMSGQSNMVGMGQVYGAATGTLENITKVQGKFPNFLTSSNTWTTRNDVRYRGVVTAPGNALLTPGQGTDANRLGTELGFGHVMGYCFDEPVLLLKASQGNRSLFWDFCPPGTPRVTYGANTYAGYGDMPNSWPTAGGGPSPFVWWAGYEFAECFLAENDSRFGVNLGWVSGTNYASGVFIRNDGVTYSSKSAHTSSADSEPGVGASWSTYWNVTSFFNASDVLDGFATQYPQWAAQGFEIAGYVWFQGNKDIGTGDPYVNHYETNMVTFINNLRAYFEARYPTNSIHNAPFVLATGCGDPQTSGNGLLVAQAQLAMNDTNKYPAFAGNVKCVDSRGYWRDISESPGTAGYHYNLNAETYTLTGDALGRAMISLLAAWDTAAPTPNPMTFAVAPAALTVTSIVMTATTATDPMNPQVKYYFENTTNAANSGWIAGRVWTNVGLSSGPIYGYRVKARDAWSNETAWSAVAFAQVLGSDTIAPTPNPMTFAVPPAGLTTTSIVMTATTATDAASPPVAYYFENTTNTANSGWIARTVWTNFGLSSGPMYGYRVKARDAKSNETAWSAVTDGRAKMIPLVSNAAPYSAGATSAALNGILASTGDDTTTVCTYWGESDGGTNKGSWGRVTTNGILDAGPFSANVAGLWYGIRYYYRCYATNSVGHSWAGSTTNFVTDGWGPDGTAGWSYTNWTGDADSGISSNYTYTAIHAFQNNFTGITVNGVYFPCAQVSNGVNWCIGGNLSYNNGDDTAQVTNESEKLAQEYVSGGNPRTMTCSGLTIGQAYKLETYSVGAEGAGNRWEDFLAGSAFRRIDQDTYGNDKGIIISCVYVATNTYQYFTVTPSNAADTYRMYAMDNRETIGTVGIVNFGAASVTNTSALLVGTLNATQSVCYVRAYWGTTDGGTNKAAWARTNSVGWFTNVYELTITSAITGLTAATQYYYAFHGSNEASGIWDSTSGVFTTTGTPPADTIAPTPNPMTFAVPPAGLTINSIVMTATTATDPSAPAAYYFENTTNAANSGWISITVWTNTGLSQGVTYGYRVKVRDAVSNETTWSAVANAQVVLSTPPTASFTAAPESGYAPLAVTFTDNSTAGSGSIISRCWTFGDGVGTNTASTSLVHMYAGAGSFSARLMVTNSGGQGGSVTGAAIVVATVPPPTYSGGSNAPVLTIDPSGGCVLTIAATNGIEYRVLYKNSLTDTNGWQPLTNDWTSGTNNGPIAIVHTGATNQPSRFYRIQAESKDATP